MKEELSQQTFESRLRHIETIYAYVDIKQKSDYVMIVFHEHIGLQNYVRLMAHQLCNNQISIVMPNFFITQSKAQSAEDDVQFVKGLNPSVIMRLFYQLALHFQKQNKRIVVVGFSIGAAVALKFLEFYHNVEFAMLFYGFPVLETTKSQRIETKTTIYVGKNDKIKHLSDKKMVQAAKELFLSNQYINIVELNGAQHGFMNLFCPNHNKKLVDQCAKEFKTNLQQSQSQKYSKQQLNRLKSKNTIQSKVSLELYPKVSISSQAQVNKNEQSVQGSENKSPKKQEQSGCSAM